jgi:hypothetical protein
MAKVKKFLSTAVKEPVKPPDPAQIAEAIDYKLQGHSYEMIAEQMKITPQAAMEFVTAGLIAMVRDDPFQRLLIDLQRIDQMLAAVYPATTTGDTFAIQTTINLRKEREAVEKKFERMDSFRRHAPLIEEKAE